MSLDLFEEAAKYTMDAKLREILLNCSMGEFSSKFKVDGTSIIIGESHIPIPSDPMELCNTIHDIMTRKKVSKKASQAMASTTRVRNGGFSLDELYFFAVREAERLGKGDDHANKIWGCIYSSIYLKEITPVDLIYKGDLLISIRGIDTSIPRLTRGET